MLQQLSFLELSPRQDAVPAWNALEEEHRTRLVVRLARLMAKTVVTLNSGEHHDERVEQNNG